MKKVLTKFVKKIKDINLWYYTVFKEHNKTKLSFFDKLKSIKYGFPSDLYKMYNLNKKNHNLYINEYTRIKTRNIDGKYKVILDNKLLFEKMFNKYLTIPKNIIIIFDKLYDNNGDIINENNLDKILTNEKYIIKPAADTGGGVGVSMITKKNNKYIFDRKELNCKELYRELLKNNNYIVTEFVEQHEYSEKINPYSTNSIRIITLKDQKTGEFIIPCAIHRFGSKKSGVVDNASRGGFITNIDIKNGILLDTKTFSDLKSLDRHPDTNVLINGTKLPNWDIVTKKIIDTAKKFPYISFIAWDVVITKEGFSVIEGNASSGLNIFQIFGPIKDTKLGEFYKYHGYIKK